MVAGWRFLCQGKNRAKATTENTNTSLVVLVLVRINHEGEQVLSLKQIKEIIGLLFGACGRTQLLCNEAISHHTTEVGDSKERIATVEDGK